MTIVSHLDHFCYNTNFILHILHISRFLPHFGIFNAYFYSFIMHIFIYSTYIRFILYSHIHNHIMSIKLRPVVITYNQR